MFADDEMGGHFHAIPEGDLAGRYDLEFALLRGVVEGKLCGKGK
jgi:hypothetical protein